MIRAQIITTGLATGLGFSLIEVAIGLSSGGLPPLAAWSLLLLPLTLVCLLSATKMVGALWPWLFTLVLAYFASKEAFRGPQARELFGASAWPWLAPIALAGICRLSFTAWFKRNSWLAGLGIGACLLSYGIAGLAYRGHYSDLKGWAGLTVLALAASLTPKQAPGSRLTVPTLLLASALMIAAPWVALQNQESAAWIVQHSAYSASYTENLRNWRLSGQDDEQVTLEGLPNSYFGSPIQKQAQALFDSDRVARPQGFLFVTIDALRRDMLGRQVGGRQVTPFLDSLQEDTVHFDRAYSPSPSSHTSLFSFFSGLMPRQIFSGEQNLDDIPLITTRLRAAGVECRAVYSHAVHTANSDDQPFSNWDFNFELATLHPFADHSVEDTFKLLRPRRAAKSRRWFAYLHIMLPHAPYQDAKAEFRAGDGEFAEYAAEVRQADDYLKRLVDRFREAALSQNMWLMVSADHGEAFGEHGNSNHGSDIYEESVAVPLIIHGLGIGSRRVEAPVSLAELSPTLDDVFQLEDNSRPYFDGRSLLPLVLGVEDPDRSAFLPIDLPVLNMMGKRNMAALVSKRWKLLEDYGRRFSFLFDLANDPNETKNLIDEEPAQAELMRRQLLGRRQAHSNWLKSRGTVIGSVLPPDLARTLRESLKWIYVMEKEPSASSYQMIHDPKTQATDTLALVLPHLAEFNDIGDLRPTIQRWENAAKTSIKFRRAIDLLKYESGSPASALLLESYRRERNPLLRTAIVRAFTRRADPGLLTIEPEPLHQPSLIFELAWACYLQVMKPLQLKAKYLDDIEVINLLDRVKAVQHPFCLRLGTELIWRFGKAGVPPKSAAVELALYLETLQWPSLRATSLETIGFLDTAAQKNLLKRTFQLGPDLEKAAVARAYLAGRSLPKDVLRLPIAKATPDATRCEVEIPASKAGAILALMPLYSGPYTKLEQASQGPRCEAQLGDRKVLIDLENHRRSQIALIAIGPHEVPRKLSLSLLNGNADAAKTAEQLTWGHLIIVPRTAATKLSSSVKKL